MERLESHYEPTEQLEGHEKHAVFFIPIERIRVNEKQARRISRDKVERHKQYLLKHEDDLLPIDAHELEDETFIIDGNGRHRFHAYLELGYSTVPLNIKGREGFQPTKVEKRRHAA
jgi:hypothetical protein